MPKIINVKTNELKEIPENSEIRDSCEELGVPFNCKHGNCGTCMIDIISGQENLSELTEQEKDLKRDREHRLACQCKIKKGEIKIDF